MMKRRRLLITGVLLLLLGGGGAIVNVAVAWGFAAFSVVPKRMYNRVPFSQLKLPKYEGKIPQDNITDIWMSSTGLRIYEGFSVDPLVYVRRTSAGWPFSSMTGFHINNTQARGAIYLPEPNIGLQPTGRILPLLPIWPGFAINTIFYAAILWVVFFVPGMVRRRLRRRRGLCPACAYPIGTSPVCTECGAAVTPR